MSLGERAIWLFIAKRMWVKMAIKFTVRNTCNEGGVIIPVYYEGFPSIRLDKGEQRVCYLDAGERIPIEGSEKGVFVALDNFFAVNAQAKQLPYSDAAGKLLVVLYNNHYDVPVEARILAHGESLGLFLNHRKTATVEEFRECSSVLRTGYANAPGAAAKVKPIKQTNKWRKG